MGAFDDLLAEVGIRSAAQSYADVAPAPRRPMPRSMRPPEQRAVDPQIAATERARAMRQMRTSRAAELDTQQRQAFAPPRNQIAEAGQMALETTGIPGAYRANVALNEGDYGRFGGEAALGALNLLGTATAVMPVRGPSLSPRAPFARVGPSLANVVDDEGFALGAPGSLTVQALRREGRMPADESIFDQNMPVRNVPLSRLSATDHTPPERQWVDYYTQNPQHEPVFVRRNNRGDYDLIDGHHRTAAARALGASDIEAVDASGYFYPSETVRAPARPPIAEAPQQLWRGIGSPERRTPWATTSREAASDYANEGAMGIRDPNNRAPFVERVDQRPSNPLHVSNIGDLRTALGRDARRLLGKTDGDQPWEHLDSRRVQDALRQRGFDAVVLRDDFSPNGTRHDSYLFLKEAPPPIAEPPARLPTPPPREIGSRPRLLTRAPPFTPRPSETPPADAARMNRIAHAVRDGSGEFAPGLRLVPGRPTGIDSDVPFFYIEQNGRRIGDVATVSTGDELTLAPRLIPEMRRQGIGTQLYQYMERINGAPLRRSDNLTEAGAGLWGRLDRLREHTSIHPPSREIGRASDGSVMPIRPAQPFRNSLRGGSDDLREAAQRRPIRTPGLPMDEASRMGRARERGYTGPFYRGLAEPYDDAKANVAFFVDDPQYSNSFTGFRSDLGGEGGNIVPAMIRTRGVRQVPYADIERNYDAMWGGAPDEVVVAQDPKGRLLVVARPTAVRSVHAAFDPANEGSANLMGALVGGALVGAAATRPPRQ